jgi:hypothetical protein
MPMSGPLLGFAWKIARLVLESATDTIVAAHTSQT